MSVLLISLSEKGNANYGKNVKMTMKMAMTKIVTRYDADGYFSNRP